jgi:alkylation response protein AidB-like acyl-CoA dehydrogenase
VTTDAAMRVTTDAVQVLGGAGYVEDHPVERWFRGAKVLESSRAPTRSSGS